ncbi:hypothetical protein [Mesorhizobium temperatum]|uniref:Uncharacterized protein n=1 Tax=Mesorhizobium temperatum TaxID=241416 RepID=A0A271LNK8_9HYPH|nr:hypothetical protein [Mesorhizobium temperatum]PAQ09721.1 hypothetical protein CIT26_11815 [Mesorhizobium temperatum]
MARPKLGKGDSERLQMVISAEELEAIEEWQHQNRIQSKSEAIRRLCQLGLLIDNELEQIVDLSSDGTKVLANQSVDLHAVWRRLVRPDNKDLLFGQDEINDIFTLASDHGEVASEGVLAIHHLVVTLYNMIGDIVQSRTLKGGLRKSEKHVEAAREHVEEIERRNEIRRQNRFLGILYHREDTPEEVARYEALSDDEQENYIAAQIQQLSEEEAADPQAFAERYGIPPPFWDQSGWGTRLRRLYKTKYGGEPK